MIEPTIRQLEIMRFIAECVDSGRPPTVRELGAQFGIASTNGVRDHLLLLERKGLIIRRAHESRGLALTVSGRRFVDGGLPICRACGQRIRRAA